MPKKTVKINGVPYPLEGTSITTFKKSNRPLQTFMEALIQKGDKTSIFWKNGNTMQEINFDETVLIVFKRKKNKTPIIVNLGDMKHPLGDGKLENKSKKI